MKMQAFYYAMPTLAVIVIAAYIFTSVKLHKFIWFSPVVYLALIGSVGLWIKIGTNIFSISETGVLGLLALEAILLEGIIEEYRYQKDNLRKNEE
ncbi:hypothetical protein [Lactobacillus taiwanensis]|uniref:hypothetical protein n=1 Tax=Lactobacillus taiwanensis TaxID=508451 RepID=UPI000ECE2A60|nr:hypothetical protein [Lactobacillus taiwanensis]MRM98546.1 hypothetical protein [Lactobacillus taiwanensis]